MSLNMHSCAAHFVQLANTILFIIYFFFSTYLLSQSADLVWLETYLHTPPWPIAIRTHHFQYTDIELYFDSSK
ncbi:hypothetical protein AYI69_g3333 [Smittium culicis]|uniref:Uncharacterized protein n=1 Tax=Smittium culicis TaxID=133412 RepID=A0A1R1YJY9_9FUNG|nr:hypothetical protein AYI69_g3333 [Smittium culicis]